MRSQTISTIDKIRASVKLMKELPKYESETLKIHFDDEGDLYLETTTKLWVSNEDIDRLYCYLKVLYEED